MKHIWLWILGLCALLAGAWYYITYIKPQEAVSASLMNPGTAGNPASWFSGWLGYSKNGLKVGTQVSLNSFSDLAALSNAFGFNDGGNSNGVSVAGSNNGGTASSGSGAGLPTPDNSIAPTVDNSDTFSVDDSSPQSAANYDMPDDGDF